MNFEKKICEIYNQIDNRTENLDRVMISNTDEFEKKICEIYKTIDLRYDKLYHKDNKMKKWKKIIKK